MRWMWLALIACGSPPAVHGVRAGEAVVTVTSNVIDAEVYVDGRFIGNLGMLHGGLAMQPGAHRLELRHDEFFSRYTELQLARGEHKTLDLPLAAVLP